MEEDGYAYKKWFLFYRRDEEQIKGERETKERQKYKKQLQKKLQN